MILLAIFRTFSLLLLLKAAIAQDDEEGHDTSSSDFVRKSLSLSCNAGQVIVLPERDRIHQHQTNCHVTNRLFSLPTLCSGRARCEPPFFLPERCGEDENLRVNYTCAPESTITNTCGADEILSASEGYISSPNYPDHYHANRLCSWTILVPTNHTLNLWFYDLSLQRRFNASYCRDYLEVQQHVLNEDDGTTQMKTVYYQCGEPTNVDYLAVDTTATVVFRTDRYDNRRGFMLGYKVAKGLLDNQVASRNAVARDPFGRDRSYLQPPAGEVEGETYRLTPPPPYQNVDGDGGDGSRDRLRMRDKTEEEESEGGAIAGIVVAVTFLLAILIVFIVLLIIMFRKRQKSEKQSMKNGEMNVGYQETTLTKDGLNGGPVQGNGYGQSPAHTQATSAKLKKVPPPLAPSSQSRHDAEAGDNY